MSADAVSFSAAIEQRNRYRAKCKRLEAENETLRAAHQRCCDETDYCYVCDNHPSHGHAKTCALAAVSARGGDAA
jgi:hypothetical protein